MPSLSSLETGLLKLAHSTGLDTADKDLLSSFVYFCMHGIPADKKLLPKMVALLKALHSSEMRLCQWYFQLQECIKNHYRTQGNNFFFNDSKEILKGTKKFDTEDAMKHLTDRLKRCVKIPGPHGLTSYM